MRSWQVAVLAVVTAAIVAIAGVVGYGIWDENRDQRTYPGSVRDTFRVSCAEAGGSDDVCNCALRALEDEYTLEEFTRLDRIARNGDPNVAAEIQAPVAKRCATAPELVAVTTTSPSTTVATVTLGHVEAYPENGRWTTDNGRACPYEIVADGDVTEHRTATSVIVPSQVDALRYSSSCPFSFDPPGDN